MRNIEIARRLSELRQAEDACKAYTLALQLDDLTPEERMEAAVFLFQLGKDYCVPYTCFIELYYQGCFQEDILSILTDAFYKPNEKRLQNRYKRNVNLLRKYPYCFRKDFPAYHNLPIRFYPYEDGGKYIPFYVPEKRFGEYVNIQNPVITRNFFRDLEKPVLASDVFSQYELEYLTDNVRPSEYVARENHLYLHYSDWETFCSWLSVLNLRPLLEQEKIVFLIGDEISQYPIDFQERFGIDYSRYSVKPLGVGEVTRLIWHTQLSSSNGGDFFNEVFDAHPNLIYKTSLMYDSVVESVRDLRRVINKLKTAPNSNRSLSLFSTKYRSIVMELLSMKRPTDKDYLIATFLTEEESGFLDSASRIVPALFFQPHFHAINVSLSHLGSGETCLYSPVLNQIRNSSLLNGFKYIKAFTPLRRFTTSFGSTVRFIEKQMKEVDYETVSGVRGSDRLMGIILNRTYLRDLDDRLYRDSVIVRFEDGKLNPEATFSKLAAFLDIPYTESMTYCSVKGVRDAVTEEGNAVGFDPVTVYKNYDEFCGKNENILIEYFLRDAYQYYGYDFHYYDGQAMDERKIIDLLQDFTYLNGYKREVWAKVLARTTIETLSEEGQQADTYRASMNEFMEKIRESRLLNMEFLMSSLRFVNKRGQPLEMTPMLQPDPALLVQPLYH